MLRRRPRDWDLAGKVVVIAGGTRGLGLELVRQLARSGARLAILGKDAERLAILAAELAELGAEAVAQVCDVRSTQQLRVFVGATVDAFGRIDAVINCVGVLTVGPVVSQVEEDYREAMDVIFHGPVQLNAVVLPGMLERGEGRIVNVGSIGGEAGIPRLSAYSGAKAALHAYSQNLHAELAPHGISVTTVIPGLMRTGSYVSGRFKGQHESEYAWFSVISSLPGFSVSAPHAARSIIRAMRKGEAEVLIGANTRISAFFMRHSHVLTRFGLRWMNVLLPGRAGRDTRPRLGSESTTPLSDSVLTKMSRDAAKAYRQHSPLSAPPVGRASSGESGRQRSAGRTPRE